MRKEEILFIETWGKHTEEIAKDFSIKIKEFRKEFTGSKLIKVLADASRSIKTDHEARRVYTKLTKEKDFLAGGVVAVYGANVLIKTVTEFMLFFVKKRVNVDIRFFTNKKEALKWLRAK